MNLYSSDFPLNDNLSFHGQGFSFGQGLSFPEKKVIGAVTGLGLAYLLEESHQTEVGASLVPSDRVPLHLVDHLNGKSYQEFWDIILVLDRRCLHSELQLTSAQAFRHLFDLVDTCDRVFIPALSYNEEHGFPSSSCPSKHRENPKSSHLTSFTRLCQWAITSPKRRNLLSSEARLRHLELPALPQREIYKQLELLRDESANLPSLHRLMFLGIIDALQTLNENQSIAEEDYRLRISQSGK